MADITITIKAAIETEVADAFLASYANPNAQTGLELCQEKCENFVLGVLNEYRKKEAADTALEGVTEETDLST